MTASHGASLVGHPDPDVEALFDDLEADSVTELRGYLRSIGVNVSEIEALPVWNAVSPPTGLTTALEVASRTPHGVALLMLFLERQCAAVWEVSYHYGPIWAALRGPIAWLAATGESLPEPDRVTAYAAAGLLEILGLEIEVENAMTAGQVDGVGDAADRVVARLDQAAAAAEAARTVLPRLGAYVVDSLANTGLYQSPVREAGRSLQRFFTDPGHSLQPAIDRLAAAEQEAQLRQATARAREEAGERKGRVFAGTWVTELRAHRFSLQALMDTAARPWLSIDSGKLVYIYPFVVLGSPAEAARRAAREASRWDLDGVVPADSRPNFSLDDVWDGTDMFGRSYDGSLVELPDVTVHDRAGNLITTLPAQIRVSLIGNHYLRLEADLSDAGPQRLYSALFLAAPEHGTVRVDVEGRRPDAGGTPRAPWDRLADFAEAITTAVARELGGLMPERDAGGRDTTLARRVPYHLIAVVHAASASTGPVGPRTELRTRDELLATVGVEVLLNPVTHCVSSLAEWSRYPVPARTNVMPEVTARDDVVVRTANTTVFVSLGQPSFHTETRETVAELVASSEAFFARWGAEFTLAYGAVEAALRDSERLDESATTDDVRASAQRLREEHRRINDLVAEMRSAVALVESPALVASPVVSEMKARLLAEAGFRHRAAELDRQVDQVLGQPLINRIDATARSLAQRLAQEEQAQQQRARRRMDTALAVIAAVGVSGLGQIIQAGYDVRQLGALLITLAVVILAVGFGWTVRRGAGTRAERRIERRVAGRVPRPRSEAPTGTGDAQSVRVGPGVDD